MQLDQDEFLETVAIIRGDSFDERNNLTHAVAYRLAREYYKEREKNMQIVKGKIQSPQKVVIYGESGVGKTTIGSQFDKPLIIDAERSSTHIDTPRVFVNTWEELLNAMNDCLTSQADEFATIVLDTVDWAETKCAEFICAKFKQSGIESFGYGKGYVYLEEEFRSFLKLCDKVIAHGKNVVFLAHQTLRKIEPPDEGVSFDRYEPKLSKKVNPLVVEWCDALLFMYRKTFVEAPTTSQRRLWTRFQTLAKFGTTTAKFACCASRKLTQTTSTRSARKLQSKQQTKGYTMTFTEYQQEAVKFRTGEANCAEYLELGLIEEIGEVAGKLAKRKRDGVFDKLAFISELGDVLWFVANLADFYKINELEFVFVDYPKTEYKYVCEMGFFAGLFAEITPDNRRGVLRCIISNIGTLAQRYGFTLEQVAEANILKLKDRASRGVINGNGDDR